MATVDQGPYEHTHAGTDTSKSGEHLIAKASELHSFKHHGAYFPTLDMISKVSSFIYVRLRVVLEPSSTQCRLNGSNTHTDVYYVEKLFVI